MADYQFDLPVNSEQLQAIGMVAAEWSYLESILDTAIWGLGYMEEDTGAAVTTHLSVPARIDMLVTLFHNREGDADATTKLRKICDTIRQSLSRKRGEVIHTRWITGEAGTDLSYSVRARGRLERTKKVWPASEIRDIAAEIAQCSDQLQAFLQAHGVVDSPSPEYIE
jgi:hypothetical protein